MALVQPWKAHYAASVAAMTGLAVRPTKPARRLHWASLILVGALAIAACSDDGEGPAATGDAPAVEGSLPTGGGEGDQGGGEDSGEQAPQEPSEGDTGSGDTGGSDTGGSTEPESDDGLTGEQWLALIFFGILIIAVVAALAAAAGRRSDRRGQQAAARQRLDQVVSSARWAHDQAAVTVLSTDRSVLQTTWSQIQASLLNVESTAAAVGDPAASQVGRSVTDLRIALDTYVNTVVQPSAEQQSVEAAHQACLQRNDQLQLAIDSLTSTYR